MNSIALRGGFDDVAVQSAYAFRACLEALARPGSLQTISGAKPPAPLSPAAGAVVLTLCDGTTPLHLAGAYDCALLCDWITFHCGAPLVAAEHATFALGDWCALAPLSRFARGLPDYPDRSATLIVEMPELVAFGARLSGPGIAKTALLSLPETAAFQANRAMFPLGFDCFFTCANHVAGLPRSTQVETV
jgi:alpha-D-ribose 1-methylphosphonate 5-triphosphate synthase subunit PhnH